MHLLPFSIGMVILGFCVWQYEATKACYKAKICMHDGEEKCGINYEGKPRRFLDTCDLLEYNCLFNDTYGKAKLAVCSELPPLDQN